jgi:hypothetical protein
MQVYTDPTGIIYGIWYIHTRNLEAEEAMRQMLTTQSVFYVGIVSFGYWFQEGQQNCGESCWKGCMCVKDWFKRMFPVFRIRFLRKLKFSIPMVEFPFPPNPGLRL